MTARITATIVSHASIGSALDRLSEIVCCNRGKPALHGLDPTRTTAGPFARGYRIVLLGNVEYIDEIAGDGEFGGGYDALPFGGPWKEGVAMRVLIAGVDGRNRAAAGPLPDRAWSRRVRAGA